MKCEKCAHYNLEGTFCGYNAHSCTAGHDIESNFWQSEPVDYSNCKDYLDDTPENRLAIQFESERKQQIEVAAKREKLTLAIEKRLQKIKQQKEN